MLTNIFYAQRGKSAYFVDLLHKTGGGHEEMIQRWYQSILKNVRSYTSKKKSVNMWFSFMIRLWYKFLWKKIFPFI